MRLLSLQHVGRYGGAMIDVTVPVSDGMVVYPGDPAVRLERVQALAAGDPANLSRLDFGVHSGTHVDAPAHFFDGAPDADALPLEVLIGPACVVDATAVEDGLTRSELEKLPLPDCDRLLFRTKNSELWALDRFVDDFVQLDGEGARLLVERGARLVGIDYLSVGDPEAHRVLLGAGVVVLESLDLRAVEAGRYQLVCLPLKLVGADGAPARAVLLPE